LTVAAPSVHAKQVNSDSLLSAWLIIDKTTDTPWYRCTV